MQSGLFLHSRRKTQRQVKRKSKGTVPDATSVGTQHVSSRTGFYIHTHLFLQKYDRHRHHIL